MFCCINLTFYRLLYMNEVCNISYNENREKTMILLPTVFKNKKAVLS